MHADTQPKSKSLLGVTELTLVATVKDGLIPALDTRSYTSRVALVMKALNTLRQSSREAEPVPLIQDAVDRIRAIHSFRLSLLGPKRRQLMLSVTFDGGWEPYMRQIWRDLGPLLDLIFCNCEDYLTSHNHPCAEYFNWVRKVQVNTDFFYVAGAQTVNDLHYLRQRETARIDKQARPAPPDTPQHWCQQALPGITALYRLNDMYPRWLPDENSLLTRAARRLLGEEVFNAAAAFTARTPTERQALEWFRGMAEKPPEKPPAGNPSAQQVQGGILEAYEGITHGCLLLVALDDARAAQQLLAYVKPRLVSAAGQLTRRSEPFLNIAFTWPGLVLAGLPEGLLLQLPPEFREGMAARAGLLGDWRHNHPLHWRLPSRNGPGAGAGATGDDRVELSSVHVLLQLQGSYPQAMKWRADPVNDADHPLHRHLSRMAQDLHSLGARVLSVQPMQRLTPHPQPARGHFDYVDGISQPTLGAQVRTQYKDHVPSGDLLLGFANSLGDPALSGPLWSHSSFLVVRKLQQNVRDFQDAVAHAVAPATAPSADDAKGLLMGRRLDGNNLVNGRTDNDFDYQADLAGARCPFQSHVRRANPRTPTNTPANTRDDQKQVPRILRRGLSYGPKLDSRNGNEERGLMFMAYNASIAEQFEVVQAWLAGGNSASSDSWSGQRDPFLGVPLDDEPLDFVFTSQAGQDLRVHLQPDRPWVRLQWGLYLFVPSIPALDELQRHAETAAATESARNNPSAPAGDRQRVQDQQNARIGTLAARGAALIKGLQLVEQAQGFDTAKLQWKLMLEDLGARSSGNTQALWTAIRELHGGVLRTPYGLLLAGKKQVMEAFANASQNLSVSGYQERMEKSFGPVYLGLDAGDEYLHQSVATNQAIQAITRVQAFNEAYLQTRRAVLAFTAGLGPDEEVALDVKDLADTVLAGLSTTYFGLPDGTHLQAGGWHGQPDMTASCPAHFHAPSRYLFQPQPGEQAERIGQEHGALLKCPVKKFVTAARQSGSLEAPIGKAVLAAITDDAEAARTLIGALMGFLPTVDGNLRAVLYEWVNDRSLWDHQSALMLIGLAGTDPPPLASVENVLLEPLARTMQLRPVPELTWRRALKPDNLGGVAMRPGETVVVGIVSALHEDLLRDQCLPEGDPAGRRDLAPVFGGLRDGSPSAPTHACPGYEMALGVLLGVLAGLMLSARLRPTLSAMTLRLAPRAPAAAPPTQAPAA